MKFTISLICLAMMLCGCHLPSDASVERLNQQMSPEWLKEHVIPGKTTPDEIIVWFGKPFYKTSSAGSGFGATLMPDEIWTYSVRFSRTVNRLTLESERWTKSIAFSFKNGTVSDYHISQIAF